MSRVHVHGMARRQVPDPSGYGRCFGCSPHNPIGMHLVFADREGGVEAAVLLGPDYESYPGIIHGGIIATILDEAMARAALRVSRRPASTVGMRIRYARPMETAVPHRVIAEVEQDGDGSTGVLRVQGRLEAEGVGLVAVADGSFMIWTDERMAEGRVALPAAAKKSLEQFLNDVR